MASGQVVGLLLREEPPTSVFATINTRNLHTVWDFDPTTDEEMVWKIYLMGNYAGGGLTVEIWIVTDATSGNTVYQAGIERIGNEVLDIDADSFAAFQSTGAVAVPSTAGLLKKLSVTFTDGAQMDSLAANEPGRLKIRRDADNTSATDSVTGNDVSVWGVVIKET